MSDVQPESPQVPELEQRARMGRRRLLHAGLAAAPVVLAVSGRSAMAADCPVGLSPTIADSVCPKGQFIGSSHHIISSPLGLSPGYWKPNPNGQTFQPPHAWSIAPFTRIKTTSGKTCIWSPGSYLTYKDIPQDAGGWATGTRFNAIFTRSFEKRSFSRILLDDNGTLAWHFCAAYLNAAAMPGMYAMTKEEVLFLSANGCLVPGGSLLTDGQIKAFLAQTWG